MALFKLLRAPFKVFVTQKLFVYSKLCFGHQIIGVKEVLSTEPNESNSSTVTVKGWIRSVREHKENVFFHINDGSSSTHLQIVAPVIKVPRHGKVLTEGINIPTDKPIKPKPERPADGSTERRTKTSYKASLSIYAATFGSCVEVVGSLVKSLQPTQQAVEVKADKITVLGSCNFLDYPFKAKKRHSLDYIRQFPHLRPRTLTFGALARVRSVASKAIDDYFQKEGFCHVHTPILTSNDCEGAGEVFKVEPADKQILENLLEGKEEQEDEGGSDGADSKGDNFFGVPTFLTVSGQLHLEVLSGAFSKVYTFGPTFRAENSRSRHHLSEFYMIEAEISFTENLQDLIKFIEGMLKFTSEQVLNSCHPDVKFFSDNASNSKHMEMLEKFVTKPFLRMTYSEAIEILERSGSQFENKVSWGIDLHKEHERYLVRHCDDVPVFVTDYPANIKPFYARMNDDNRTVAAVDLLASGVGEICGGSLREERLEILEQRLSQSAFKGNLDWYLDLRRFGSAPHGGFGIGFERYLQVLLGIQNIKDAILFPRSTNSCRL